MRGRRQAATIICLPNNCRHRCVADEGHGSTPFGDCFTAETEAFITSPRSSWTVASLGSHFERVAVLSGRFVITMHVIKNPSERRAVTDRQGIEFEGTAGLFDGFIEPSLCSQQPSVQLVRAIGVHLSNTPEFPLSHTPVAIAHPLNHCETSSGFRKIRVDVESLSKRGFGFGLTVLWKHRRAIHPLKSRHFCGVRQMKCRLRQVMRN